MWPDDLAVGMKVVTMDVQRLEIGVCDPDFVHFDTANRGEAIVRRRR